MDKKTDGAPLQSPALIQIIIDKAPAGVIVTNLAGGGSGFLPGGRHH